jgi:hypothetical protein
MIEERKETMIVASKEENSESAFMCSDNGSDESFSSNEDSEETETTNRYQQKYTLEFNRDVIEFYIRIVTGR